MLSACSTIKRTPRTHFRIDTVPQGARIMTSVETSQSASRRFNDPTLAPTYIGCDSTPCAIKLPRYKEFIVRIEHDGYESAEIFIDSSTNQGVLASSIGTTTTVASASTAFMAAYAYGMTSTFGGSAAASAAAANAIIAPAFAITGGAFLIDATTSANKNFFPNPVILGLAPKGTPVRVDPLAVLFKRELEAEENYRLACRTNEKKERGVCNKAAKARKMARKNRAEFTRAYYAALKENAEKARKAETERKKELPEDDPRKAPD